MGLDPDAFLRGGTSMSQAKLKKLKQDIAPFESTDTKKSIMQIINTLGPLVLLWYAAYASLSVSYWLTLPFAIVAAGFVVRTFIICHDCTHSSFFKSRTANDIVGTITGILTLVPYQQWKYTHSVHHATSSNLDKRGVGDVWIMTVEEFEAASSWKKLGYRIYRHPLVMFGIGPIWIFLVDYRFNRATAKMKERINTYITNVALVAIYGGLGWAIGWEAFLLVQGTIIFVSGLLGVWLFYVQHQFEDSYFEKEEEWSYVQAAVEGSSYYKLPKVLQWITGNIGFHHVHHLSPRVPNYKLEQAHNAIPPLHQATTITIGTSLGSLRFKLWDERGKRFVGFKDVKQLQKIKKQEAASVAEPVRVPRPSMQGE
jgi:acyl-lipid omega-6 desaturase (Delta-12 desaturase)